MQIRVTQSAIFLSICLEATCSYADSKQKLDAQNPDSILDPSVRCISTEVCKQQSIAIIFAQAFLEAFIFDYGSQLLGDECYMEHLEKQDILSKYIAILSTLSNSWDVKHSPAINGLREIVCYRNELIHSKSFIGNGLQKYELDKIENKFTAQDRVTLQLSKSLLTIMNELHGFDPCDATAFCIQRIEAEQLRQKYSRP